MQWMRVTGLVLLVLGAMGATAGAKTLVEVVQSGFGNDVLIDGRSAIGDSLGNGLEALAFRGINFPLTSTAPGFTFRYNPQAGMFERSESLGSVLTERPETIGRGQFDVGVGVIYGKLDQINGRSVSEFPFGISLPDRGVSVRSQIENFDLEAVQTSITATYGLTDDWDVNLVVPLVYTNLSADLRSTVITEEGSISDAGRIDESRFGVGDVTVRTKYRLLEVEDFAAAAELGVQFPTGEEGNFHGTGDFLVTPTFIAGYSIGRHNIHLNGGVEYDANNVSRSRARYALGASLQLVQPLAFLVDILGSSDFDGTAIASRISGVPATTVGRKDLIDLSMVFKADIAGRAVAFAGVIVPLTDDGLRADVLPLGGIQVPF